MQKKEDNYVGRVEL